MKKTKIAIIGLGWFGLPLAKNLYDKNYEVIGSTTSTEKFADLVNQPFKVRRLIIKPNGIVGNLGQFIENVDVLVLNIPPDRNKNTDAYGQQIQTILNVLETKTKVIFISSTSVYGNPNASVNESTLPAPIRAGGKAVLNAENRISESLGNRATIVRFAGLVGPDRHPGRFLSKVDDIDNPNGYVNLIHLDDCIQIVRSIIEQSVWGEIINGCADEHPKRDDFYNAAAYNLSLTPPQFNASGNSSYKIVDNSKSKSLLSMTYQMSNPLEFFFS